MAEYSIKIGEAILLVAAYLGIMLFYTFLDVAVWRKVFPNRSSIMNIITIVLCILGFLLLLKKTGYQIQLLSNITVIGVVSAIGCSFLFFVLLDKGLDPILERMFPKSEQDYQESLNHLIKSPITSFLQVCILAPFIEELLMRGVVLGGLKSAYGIPTALLVSAALFAALHFNMVQTLSAFICGIVLGILYVKTGSVFCCMITHCGYNFLSYISMIHSS